MYRPIYFKCLSSAYINDELRGQQRLWYSANVELVSLDRDVGPEVCRNTVVLDVIRQGAVVGGGVGVN